jgi:C4-dicarboxylate-specific signal transduction histidine kinase
MERTTPAPKIVIDIDKTQVIISDNAGGIKLDDIQKVFEPYFSTKVKGLGIRLYMSKVIVEKNMDGKFEVKNGEDGLFLASLSYNNVYINSRTQI